MGEGLEKIIIYFWNLPAYYASEMGQGLEDVSCISGMGKNLTHYASGTSISGIYVRTCPPHYASVNEAGQRIKEPD
jgi:hypothetical protein